MTTIRLNGRDYNIEFRHVTRLGKRAQLHGRSPIKAVSTCVITTHDFIAIDNAICSADDNFSRREGRLRSLTKLLKHCGALREVAEGIFTYYITEIDPPRPAPHTVNRISEAQKEAKIHIGAAKREYRRAMRHGYPVIHD